MLVWSVSALASSTDAIESSPMDRSDVSVATVVPCISITTVEMIDSMAEALRATSGFICLFESEASTHSTIWLWIPVSAWRLVRFPIGRLWSVHSRASYSKRPSNGYGGSGRSGLRGFNKADRRNHSALFSTKNSNGINLRW